MKLLKKLLAYLKSRTVQVVIVTFVVNGLFAIKPFVSPTGILIIDTVLGLLAIYFRVNPKQKFEKENE